MPAVRCVHCATESDPEKTAGYCEECGKKLPGFYAPPSSSFTRRAENDAVESISSKGSQEGPKVQYTHGDVLRFVAYMAVFLSLVGLGIWAGVGQHARGISCILAVAIPLLVGFYTAIRGVFASREQLLLMSDWIGTSNPTIARVLCVVALIVLLAIAGLIASIAISPELRRSIGIIRVEQP